MENCIITFRRGVNLTNWTWHSEFRPIYAVLILSCHFLQLSKTRCNKQRYCTVRLQSESQNPVSIAVNFQSDNQTLNKIRCTYPREPDWCEWPMLWSSVCRTMCHCTHCWALYTAAASSSQAGCLSSHFLLYFIPFPVMFHFIWCRRVCFQQSCWKTF